MALAILWHSPVSSAYCPVPGIRANGEFFKSDVVLIGTVLSIRESPDTDDDVGGWFYRMRVEEIFRGPIRKVISVHTENSSARFPLQKGQKYLLFAYLKNGRLEIYGCGNSARLSEAADALTRLKSLAAGKQPSEIEGWVVAETGGIDVSGVVVTIKSKAKSYAAVTDKDGWFHFVAPPGRYKLDLSSQEYYLNGGDDFWYQPEGFVLHRGECASVQVVSIRHLSK